MLFIAAMQPNLWNPVESLSPRFGVGAGRVILRSAASVAGAEAVVVPRLSGTRSTVSLEGSPGALVRLLLIWNINLFGCVIE